MRQVLSLNIFYSQFLHCFDLQSHNATMYRCVQGPCKLPLLDPSSWGCGKRYMELKMILVAGVGHDPTTSGLWIRRSNQLSYPAINTRGAAPHTPPRPFRLSVFAFRQTPGSAGRMMPLKLRQVVEIEGLEPSLTEPESVVLPLHHISMAQNGTANVRLFSEWATKKLKKVFFFATFARK